MGTCSLSFADPTAGQLPALADALKLWRDSSFQTDAALLMRRACEQALSAALPPFLASAEYRLLLANLGAKSASVVAASASVKPANLNEGVVLVGRGSDCAIRMGDDDVNTRHLRVHTGPLSSVAEHVGCAGGTYMRGRRIRLALLLPEDTLWLGLSATPSGMQYRVKGLCSVESRSNANTGGTAVHVEPGARGLGSSLKLPLSPGPVEPPIVHHRAKSFSFRLQLSSRP